MKVRSFSFSMLLLLVLSLFISAICFYNMFYTDDKYRTRHLQVAYDLNRRISEISQRHHNIRINGLSVDREPLTWPPVRNTNRSSVSPMTEHLTLLHSYHNRSKNFRNTFNCENIFQQDQSELAKVHAFYKAYRKRFSTVDSNKAIMMLKDCEMFKKIRNYRLVSGSQEESNFPLAYIITVHKDFEHLERLLNALYQPQNVYCIHVDKKAPQLKNADFLLLILMGMVRVEKLQEAILALVACFPNVMLASNPQTVIYAHVSRLMADISCMTDILASQRPWRYLINMAATEFPLKSNRETVDILNTLHGLNDIHESFTARVESRWKMKHLVFKGSLQRSNQQLSPPPHNITVTKGQAYNVYSRAFVAWVLSDKRALDFLEWSKSTYSPDEHYWGSLNNLYHNGFLRTPGGFYGHPDMKGYLTKFISWQGVKSPRYPCHGQVVHSICVLSFEDIPILLNPKHLAANKFDLTYDPVAYFCMEERLENKIKANEPSDVQRYKRLYFVRFKHS